MNIYLGDIHSVTSPQLRPHSACKVERSVGQQKVYDGPPNYWKGISNTVDSWLKQNFFFLIFFSIVLQSHRC